MNKDEPLNQEPGSRNQDFHRTYLTALNAVLFNRRVRKVPPRSSQRLSGEYGFAYVYYPIFALRPLLLTLRPQRLRSEIQIRLAL